MKNTYSPGIAPAVRRSAFSLMEVLLALAISGIVLMLLGMAIDMQWRLFDTRRTGVEETLVARSVIRRISDDLRGAILYVPPDIEGLEAIANNPLAQMANLSGDGSATGGILESALGSGAAQGAIIDSQQSSGSNTATGSTTTDGTDSTSAEDPTATGEETPAASIVGIYGGIDWLSIDVSRLPRVDEYQAAMTSGTDLTPVDIPSDVKTVTYYVAAPDLAAMDGSPPPPPTEGTAAAPILRGLVRQQLSRAIMSWNELGNSTDSLSNAEILAEEVTAIEFGYFDGVTWYSDWDSTAAGGIPVAVALAIQVEMKRSRSGQQIAATQGEDPDLATTATIHRMVVHLPAARKAVSEEMIAAEEASDAATTESAAASSQSGASTLPAALGNLGNAAAGGLGGGQTGGGGNNGSGN